MDMGYSKEFLVNIRNSVTTQDISISPHVLEYLTDNQIKRKVPYKSQSNIRGCRAGRNKVRDIRPVISSSRISFPTRGVCSKNLHQVPIHHEIKDNSQIQFCLANARSVRNKTDEIVQYILEKNIDVCIITETWLKNDDNVIIGELVPSGYKIDYVSRNGRRGGGIAIIYKATCRLQKLEPIITSDAFEFTEVILSSGNGHARIIAVYRPPRPDPSLGHSVPISTFIEDFSSLMERHITAPSKVIVLGDFNIHVDSKSNADAKQFRSAIKSLDLHQHVKKTTHENGHILDLILTRAADKSIVQNIDIDYLLSDHFTVLFNVQICKPPPERKTVTFRALKSISIDKMKIDIATAVHDLPPCSGIEGLVHQYDTLLKELMDKHAPEQTKLVTVRHHTPWYTDILKSEKAQRRKLERQWIITKSEVDRLAFHEQRNKVSKMVSQEKTQFYSSLVTENKGDPKGLFKVIDKLLHRKEPMPLPPCDSDEELANNFANFFVGKIDKIRQELTEVQSNDIDILETKKYISQLSVFSPASEKEVRQTVMKAPSKTSSQDPIQTRFLKSCIDEILPLLTQIVNLSFSSAIMPQSLKIAELLPLLKKAILELISKNYRPVSNLTFLSKLIERIVAVRLIAHQDTNDLYEALQSAYRRGHSTETALLKVKNDILCAIDRKEVMMLILLDLSAAFDTIDHSILLKRLSERFGITDLALQWIESYLSERFQYVNINGHHSAQLPLKYGVPQGSVLGPILFSMYMAPLGDLIRKHGANLHIYADDTQIYMCAKPDQSTMVESVCESLELCVNDIKSWMSKNMLKLNSDKTEFIIFGSSKQRAKVDLPSISIGGCDISPAQIVRNLGVQFDSELSMSGQTKSIKQSCFHQLRNLRMIRPYLDQETAKISVHALVTSRLDYCNSLLYGINKCHLHHLQLAQNAAARLITLTPRIEHITPVLKDLHWLPIEQRIKFKTLLLTYKAIHELGPSYLTSLVEVSQPTRSLRSNNSIVLVTPKSNLKSAGDRAFKLAAPRLWNSLPSEIRSAQTVITFKKKLKTYLFNQWF